MKTIFKVIKREWKRILRLPVHYLVLLVLPPLIFFFFALIYQNEHVNNMSVVVWDQDNSALTRQLTFMLEQSPSIHITKQVDNLQELEDLIQSGKAWAGIHFPTDLEKSLKSNHPVNISLFTNSAAVVPAKLIYRDAARVVIMGGSGVVLQKLIKKGMNENKAMALVQPIKLNSFPLYNPTYNYQQYLAPGLITVTLQMMIIMISVLLINHEWKTNTMDDLLRLAEGSPVKIIIGKALAHLSVAWINFILIVGVIFPYFNLSHPGTTGAFFVLFTLLALACIGIGILVSSIFKDTMVASDLGLFYTSPAFVFSGYTFPRWAMPWFDQVYANLMPYTPFLEGFLKIYFMELPLSYIKKEMGILLLFIALTYPLAVLIFNRQIKPYYARIS